MVEVTKLERDSFRNKVLKSCDTYLEISDKYNLAIGIYQNGKMYVFGNGIEQDYLYDVGSISKTMTAHLILSLVEKGKIDLYSTVDKYIELKRGNYPTVYELLTHTAGYGNLTPCEIVVPSLLKSGYAKKNIYSGCSETNVIKCLEKRNKHKYKNGYGYSDFSYAILAIIASRVTDMNFDILFEKFIKEDLGLSDSWLTFNGKRFPLAVNRNKVLTYWKWETNNPYIASGGVTSSIYEMLKYLKLEIESREKFIINAHKVCSESHSKNSNIMSCIGWHTYKKSNQFWHVGGVGTFRSSMIFNKVKKYGVIVLGNAKGVVGANVHYLAKMIYSELKIKKVKF